MYFKIIIAKRILITSSHFVQIMLFLIQNILFTLNRHHFILIVSAADHSQDLSDDRRDTHGADSAFHFVADPVTEALDYVEAIEQQRHNCTFGPTLNLQYSKERWIKEAKITVRTANLLSFLSRTGSHMLGSNPDDGDLLYSIVRANVDNHKKVFGSAIAFDTGLYRNYDIFCPYAYISPSGIVTAKDLSIGYNYHTNRTDWFWVPYEEFQNYTFLEPSLNLPQRGVEGRELLTVEDGYWTQPYFDCGGGDVWMVTFSMPFFLDEDLTVNDTVDGSEDNTERVFA